MYNVSLLLVHYFFLDIRWLQPVFCEVLLHHDSDSRPLLHALTVVSNYHAEPNQNLRLGSLDRN
jgi:hypothetical protein